jgi:hypothetical protein
MASSKKVSSKKKSSSKKVSFARKHQTALIGGAALASVAAAYGISKTKLAENAKQALKEKMDEEAWKKATILEKTANVLSLGLYKLHPVYGPEVRNIKREVQENIRKAKEANASKNAKNP